MSDGQGCREQVYDFRKVDGVWQRRKLPNGRWYMLRVVKVDDGYGRETPKMTWVQHAPSTEETK